MDGPNWKQVGLAALTSALSSGMTTQMKPEELPEWTRGMAGFTDAWLYYDGGEPAASTASLSTAAIHARMDMERRDGDRLKYYRYLYIRMADGRVFQAGPYKDLDYGHHLNERPAWITQYSDRSGM